MQNVFCFLVLPFVALPMYVFTVMEIMIKVEKCVIEVRFCNETHFVYALVRFGPFGSIVVFLTNNISVRKFHDINPYLNYKIER